MATSVSILLVDDNSAFLRNAAFFLEQCGEVVVAGIVTDGRQVLVQVQALEPDIVLLDLVMPGMTGWQIIACLRAARPEIGIIAMSVWEVDSYREAALEAGADEFVSKAVISTELLPAILRVLQGVVPVQGSGARRSPTSALDAPAPGRWRRANDREGSMEIRRYLQILDSRKWVVILTTLVTLVVVTLGSFRMTRIYSASALVRIAAGLNSTVSYADLNYTERLMQTYVQLLKSRPFLEEVSKRLNLHVRLEVLAGAIKVEALTNTELIKISAESTSPQQAAAIANALGDLLVEQGQKMYYGQGKSAREILQEQVTVLEDQLRQDRALLVKLTASMQSPDQNPDTSLQDLTAKIRSEEQTYAMLLTQYDKARVDEAMRANSIGHCRAGRRARSTQQAQRQAEYGFGSTRRPHGRHRSGLFVRESCSIDPFHR